MNRNNYIRLLVSILAILILFPRCSDEFDNTEEQQKVKLKLTLVVPKVSSVETKAMSIENEYAIDASRIQVLVFEVMGSAEVFRYQATITDRTLPDIVLELPTGASGQQYRIVVLANADSQAIADGTTKEDALSQFVFACLGKWNTSPLDFSKFPMWGELGQPITIKQDQYINMRLHRAIARVDVGLLFKFNNPDPDTGEDYPQKETDKESVYGLDQFKIKNIRVYRTRSKAYVASSLNFMSGNEVIIPSIPATAKFNSNIGVEFATLAEADQNPLIYTLPAGADSYIREIYIPESVIIDEQSNMDNVPCLVVGGYYGADNTADITYYRADFATYSNGSVVSYRPILRNHQYVFDIKSVSGPGFETPEQALNSITSPMEMNVVDWDQVALNFYTQGDYNLSISEREIWMEARAQADAAQNSYIVSYQTNLELDGSDGKRFDYTWASSSGTESQYFDVNIDYTNKTFTFTAKSDNVGTGEGVRSDVITLTIENFQLDIIVNQKAFDLNFNLFCADVVVRGRYREGVPLNYSNYISLKVITRGSNMDGSAYEVRTLEKNGIYFLAEGLFDASQATSLGGGDYEYTLKLEGFGTPVNEAGGDVFAPFDVTIISNSINNDYCSARIVLGYKTKRILTIGANAIYRFGYMLEPNTASRAFVDASINFGVDPNSTVTMEENAYGNAFTIEVMTAGQGMTGEVIDYNYLKDKLNTFKPEIILTGQAINYYTAGNNTQVIDLLSDFVDAGGVFLMCNEYYPSASSIQAMVRKIMGSGVNGNNQHIAYDQIFILSASENDMITNGPFGDMRGRQWGADGHEMHGFTNLPTAQTIVYSSRTNGYINMFRHTDKPFFFMGEGGFISNSQLYIGNSYQGSLVYFPFAINSQYKPVPRINYTINGNQTIYNSLIFGNILAWAVDYAEMNGITYPATGNKFP